MVGFFRINRGENRYTAPSLPRLSFAYVKIILYSLDIRFLLQLSSCPKVELNSDMVFYCSSDADRELYHIKIGTNGRFYRHSHTEPSAEPSSKPSGRPTSSPSGEPSSQPSTMPTGKPSFLPSGMPTGRNVIYAGEKTRSTTYSWDVDMEQ